MRQGVTLGYVRDSSLELPRALDRFLDQRRNEYGVSKMPEAVTFSLKRMRMHETTHERKTKNLQTGDPLGPIRVFHLWLSVEAALGRPVRGRTLPAAA